MAKVDGEKIRVVIADDNPAIRSGVRRLLERSGRIEVVGEAKNGLEAVQLVAKHRPQVLILDIEMPVMNGIEALDQLMAQKSDVCVLILSAYDDPHFVRGAFERGAKGYLTKDTSPSQLVGAVELAYQG